MMKVLWVLFMAGQILNAGNMNYQQEIGYYETTSYYSKHPSKKEVYVTKAAGTLAVYCATELLPGYKEPIMVGANLIVWGFIYSDKKNGISLSCRW